MLLAVAALLTLTFLALAGLHLHWLAGGTRGLAASLPAHANGRVIFRPPGAAVLLVALGLLALAGLAAAHLESAHFGLKASWLRRTDWVLAGLFLLRAVGDFKFVGFSKRVRGTTFARLDSRYYSPLCVALAAGWAALAAWGFAS